MARSNSVPLEKSSSVNISRDMGNSNNNNTAAIDNNVGTFEFEVGSFNIQHEQNHGDQQIVSSADVSNLLLFAAKSFSANDFQANQFVSADVDIKPSMIIQHKQQQQQAIPITVLNNSSSNKFSHSSTDNDISYDKILLNTSSTLNNNENVINCSATIHDSSTSTLIIKEDKVCVVCGDRALGCNFDVVSCESCKAFFRRNAHKEKEMKCIFDGCCYINVHTRRFCSYCRLKQCMQAGMRKELILGTEEKRKRMELVKQNRKRKFVETTSSLTSSSSSLSSSPIANHHGNTNNNNNINLMTSQVLLTSTSSTTPSPPTVTTPNVTNNLIKLSNSSYSENTNLLTISRTDISPNNNSKSLINSSSLMTSSQSRDQLLVRKLSAEECHMLIELNQVYDLSFTVDVEPLVHITQLNPSLNQIVNQSSITVLRLIKFAKRLEDFVKLTQDLQISILKGCWFHLLLLRPVSLFDADRDVWATPNGDIPTEILKNATGYVDLHDDHIRYCRSLKALIGSDATLLVILLVLVLFSPDGPHVIAPEIISNIQDRYLVLLKHYLEAKYTFKRSVEMFPRLLSKIRDLNSLVETHAKVLMDINPHEIEPIMLEILDLKSC